MGKFKVNQTVVHHGRKATVMEVIDSYDDEEIAFKFKTPMYDIEYNDGKGGAIVKESELVSV